MALLRKEQESVAVNQLEIRTPKLTNELLVHYPESVSFPDSIHRLKVTDSLRWMFNPRSKIYPVSNLILAEETDKNSDTNHRRVNRYVEYTRKRGGSLTIYLDEIWSSASDYVEDNYRVGRFGPFPISSRWTTGVGKIDKATRDERVFDLFFWDDSKNVQVANLWQRITNHTLGTYAAMSQLSGSEAITRFLTDHDSPRTILTFMGIFISLELIGTHPLVSFSLASGEALVEEVLDDRLTSKIKTIRDQILMEAGGSLVSLEPLEEEQQSTNSQTILE